MKIIHCSLLSRCVLHMAALVVSVFCTVFPFPALTAPDLMDGLQDILDTEKPDDYAFLKDTCFTELKDWIKLDKAEALTNYWAEVRFPEYALYASAAKGDVLPLRTFVRPRADIKPLAGWLAVPEAGAYRIWLGQMMEPARQAPALMRISGATTAEHLFGAKPIPRGESGRQIEKTMPVCFENDEARSMPAMRQTPVWEYWDVKLPKGTIRVELTPQNTDVTMESLVLTRSARFTPRKAIQPENNTLTRAYLRYRVTSAEKNKVLPPFMLHSFVVFNWCRHRLTSTERIYYGSVGKITDDNGAAFLKQNQWSKWIDITEEAVTDSGLYATDTLRIMRARDELVTTPAVVEVQYAWFPHPGAVLNTVRATTESGSIRYSFPATHLTYRATIPGHDEASATWGARDHDYAKVFRGEKEMLEDLAATLDAMNLGDVPTPKRLVFYTTCQPAEQYLDLAVPRLQKLGFNWLDIPLKQKRQYGLIPQVFTSMQAPLTFSAGDSHDPNDPTFEESIHRYIDGKYPQEERDKVTMLGMGDEIGPFNPRIIRYTADGRDKFKKYLTGELARLNTNASFFGVSSLDDVLFPLALSERPSVYERRLWFHAEDFLWRFTSDFYLRFSRAAKTVLPNLRSLANYTPGSFMHAGTMRSSNWFALLRYGGATMGWGEDWLGGTGWYAMAGIQSVSYYAAVIECAIRKYRHPGGFILVAKTGAIDRKMLSLVAHGISFIHVYSWGPEYVGPVGDRFSNATNCYPMIVRGIQALAPAEEIITQGQPEPRRTAVLYNLCNEYWNQAYAGMHFDRLLTFLALLHAHVPVDLILEEDLTPETLAGYKTVYVQGFNMQRRHISVLAEWVKDGGTLVGSSGAAMRDEYDNPMPEAAALFGASQRSDAISEGSFRPVEITDQKPIDTITFSETELTPALTMPVVGVKLVLAPTTGRAVAEYADGSCGAVINTHGKGRTLLLGVMPGHLYRHNAPRDENEYPTTYTADRRELVVKPALLASGPFSVKYSEPLVEISRFDHDDGIAVLLNDFSYAPGRKAVLTVKTDRKIISVQAAHAGRLEWERDGENIVVQAPIPDPVDVIILR